MPGVKCGNCSKFVSPIDGAKCGICSHFYHRQCAALPQIGTIASPWCCLDCKKKVAKVTEAAASNSPDATSSATNITVADAMGDFQSELRRIGEELRSVRNELSAFREEMAEIRALSGRVEAIEKRLDALEQLSTNHTSEKVEEVVAQFKRELNNRDQERLANDVEISNLPESAGENLTHTVVVIAAKLGVTLEGRDIVSADRVGGRRLDATKSSGPNESRPRSIVVRIASRDLRDALLKGARVRRGANTADLGLPGQPRRFFVNERLTKSNRLLFRQARDAGQQKGWKFVWTSRGRILARQRPGDAVCQISCEADLSRCFGPVGDEVSEVAL